jgi:molybdenum cofactor biosynthesis protein B
MAKDHRADSVRNVQCALVTVSDTRTPSDDRSGLVLRSGLEAAGHVIVSAHIVPDDHSKVRPAVIAATERPEVQAVIVTGGTGVAARDVTIESLAGAWQKELPGFGEIFRAQSFAEIGAAAFLSRATAGIIADTFVAVLPGSPSACTLALERLILPELAHVVGLLGKAARS